MNTIASLHQKAAGTQPVRTLPRIDRILCPIALDSPAGPGLASVARLAMLNQAELRLLHVVPRADSRPRAAHGQSDATAERALADVCALTRRLPGRIRASAAVTEGNMVEEVVRHALLMKADVLAICARAGRTSGGAATLATAAADARVPVLFISAEPQEDAAADSVVVMARDAGSTVSASCAAAARVAARCGRPVLLQP